MSSASRKLILVVVLVMVAPCAGGPTAGPPEVMRYQGRLTDGAGVPISGSITTTFAVYATEVGGTALWSEVHSLSLQAGAVDVILGESIPLASAIVNAPDRWLEVTVNDGSGAKVLGPRQRLASVPFALVADRLGTKTLTEVQADVAASIGTHTANASAHHVKTTSASELTSGTLDPARIAPDSLTTTHVLDGPGSSLNADLLDNLHANELIDAAGPLVCQTITYGFGSIGPANTSCGSMSSRTLTCPVGTVLLSASMMDPNGVTLAFPSSCVTFGSNSIQTKCVTSECCNNTPGSEPNQTCSGLANNNSQCGFGDAGDVCSRDRVVLNCCQ